MYTYDNICAPQSQWVEHMNGGVAGCHIRVNAELL